MTDRFRWGILGAGTIAQKFCTGVQTLADHQLVAVGSRSEEKAESFGEQFGIGHRHASYEALVADPDVDAIYVATPHALHKDHALLALRAGKHVLCEKPFTINAAEAKVLIDEARTRQRFLMEAMWMRFIPGMVEAKRLISSGAIGEVRMLTADCGFRTGVNPESRLFAPELGGGGLLDVGVYPISLASMLLGRPERIATLATLGESGVDEQSAFILGYPGGQLATLYTAIRTKTPLDCVIMGTEGMLCLHPPFLAPQKLTLTQSGKEAQLLEVPFAANGYQYQAAEVANCVRAGKLESARMPLDESLQIMATMDSIRAQWGLKYPME